MTGFTFQALQFDNWISCNYNDLLRYCKRYRIEVDLLSDTYLNVKNRILISGYTGTQYMTFMKRSLRNIQINEKKKLNGRYIIDYDNEDYTNTIENQLQEIDEIERDSKQYQDEVMYFSKKLFEYLMTEGRYNDEWNFVFRSYYLMPNRFTYKKLNEMTGIDKVKCCRIIKTIKKDLRENFLTWLKQKNTRDI